MPDCRGRHMNKRPVSYLQTDSRWAKKPYRVPGENSTIGDSGCGPTAAAMLIETLTGKTYTPEDACAWSVAHGYKALKAGTYYDYFAPQFAEFGIKCWQLSWTNGYHNPKAKVHDQALEYLKQGYYLIALMKKGTWTGGGHFVVVWWADNKIRINDPASTRDKRLNGDPATFRNEAAYYWVVDARAYNNGGGASPAVPEYSTYTVKAGDSLSAIGAKTGVDWKTIAALNGISSPYTIHPGQVLKLAEKPKEDDDMDQDKFNKMFETAMQQYRQNLRDNDCGEWSRAARQFAVDQGIFAGSGTTASDGQPNMMWEDLLTREQCAQVLYRFAQKFNLV